MTICQPAFAVGEVMASVMDRLDLQLSECVSISPVVRTIRRWSGPIEKVNKMSLDRGGERSPSFSPVITRKGIADTPFSIPPGYKLERNDSVELARSLDVSQYRKMSRSSGGMVVSMGRGELTFSLSYCNSSERLRLDVTKLADVCSPDPVVTGSKWTLSPSYSLWLLPERRKLSSSGKSKSDSSKKGRFEIALKRNDLDDKTLRITVHDKNLKNVNLPIGHVLIKLNDMQIIDDTANLTRPLTSYSVPAGFDKGKINLAVTWIASAQKLEVKIGHAHLLKSPRGILGRDFFVRLVVYVGGDVLRTQKSTSVRANPGVDFREKFVIAMTTAQLQRCTLNFTLFAKNLVKLTSTSEEIGNATIGPFMGTSDHAEPTQWERLLSMPLEEFNQVHTLYL